MTVDQEQMTKEHRPRTSFRRWLWQTMALAAIMFTSLGGYLTVLNWRGAEAQFTTYLPWDDLVPFRPEWVWVYLIPYLVGPATIGFLRPETFRWYIQRGLVVVLATLVIFIAVPTQTAPRPSHQLADGPTARLYENMVAIDEPPANAAPSLHVSLTCLLAVALLMDFRPLWPITLAGVSLVWLATLFTRQHHLIDVVTGMVMAGAVIYAWPKKTETLCDDTM